MSDLIGPAEAAEMLGKTTRWVTELFSKGNIKAQKVGSRWVTTVKAVEAYQRRQGRDSRKRK